MPQLSPVADGDWPGARWGKSEELRLDNEERFLLPKARGKLPDSRTHSSNHFLELGFEPLVSNIAVLNLGHLQPPEAQSKPEYSEGRKDNPSHDWVRQPYQVFTWFWADQFNFGLRLRLTLCCWKCRACREAPALEDRHRPELDGAG